MTQDPVLTKEGLGGRHASRGEGRILVGIFLGMLGDILPFRRPRCRFKSLLVQRVGASSRGRVAAAAPELASSVCPWLCERRSCGVILKSVLGCLRWWLPRFQR